MQLIEKLKQIAIKSLLLGIFICSALVGRCDIVIDSLYYFDGNLSLEEEAFLFYDPTDTMTFQQVIADSNLRNCTLLSEPMFTVQNNKTYWVFVTIRNESNVAQSLVWRLKNSFLSNVEFYSTKFHGVIKTGCTKPFITRPIPSDYFDVNFSIESKTEYTYAARISNLPYSQTTKISLTSFKEYLHKTNKHELLIGGLFWILFVELWLSINMLWAERTASTSGFVALVLGSLTMLLSQHPCIISNIITSPTATLTIIRTFLFMLSLLLINYFITMCMVDPDQKFSRKVGYTTITLGLIVSLVSLVLPYRVMIHPTLLLELLSLFLLTVAAYNYKQKNPDYYIKLGVLITIHILILWPLICETFGTPVEGTEHTTIATVLVMIFIVYVYFDNFHASRQKVLNMNKTVAQNTKERTDTINRQKEEIRLQHDLVTKQRNDLLDQRELLRAQKEILEQRTIALEQVTQVTDKTQNSIAIFKTDGTITWFNSQFSRHMNMSLETYKSGHPMNILDVIKNKELQLVLPTCIREKMHQDYETEYKDPNGNESKWTQTTLTPVMDKNNRVKIIISIETDITSLKTYETRIEVQKRESEKQRNNALRQKEELELKQEEIFGSIKYAKRIQTALMPKISHLQREFPESFVLFMPKDIVSGDFYWYHRINNKYFIAAVDCTGHGVPGAFMSIVGNYLLNSIIIHNGIYEPATILKHLNRKIKISLKGGSVHENHNDGMDIALAVIDADTETLEFAGAMRPMFLFQNKELIELKGNKIPITCNITNTSTEEYTNHTYPFKDGDTFYIFSDGYQDQFGGDNGMKFMAKRLKQLIVDNYDLSMNEQRDLLKNTFEEWKGSREQIDDVLVIGVRNIVRNKEEKEQMRGGTILI
ncbi:MAG: SpoIIE family protein phosphatase [Salinivirgaceae bacterium]|nr:SpoIIE family protein phosphatase [Salinivirgaceae bacterium]